MLKLSTKLTAPILAVLALMQSAIAPANDERWFRVELLVIAHETAQQPEGAAIAEQWDATPTLAYPLASRFLIDTARVAENQAEFQGESLVDEYGRQIITILTEGSPIPGAANTGEGGFTQDIPESGLTAGSAGAPAAAPAPVPVRPTPVYQGGPPPGVTPTGAEPVVAQPPALPRPFVLLSRDYQEFQGKAAQMQRSGRYSVLFHETWVQPVAAEARSLPIVLDRSGDTLGWPRLQGTITLFLSRYLHVQTNLWINTAGEYLPGSWQMPAPPLGPPSLIIEEQGLIDIAAAIDNLSATAVPGVENAAAMEAEGPAGMMAGEDSQLSRTGEEAEKIVEELAPVYPYRHAVLLEQTRRMRSNEVHYIDHPLLGVIVKFTPVTAQELGAIAAAQATAADGDQAP